MPSRSLALLPCLLGAALSLAALGCRATSQEESRNVAWLVRHGEYEKARDRARALVEERPDDPAAKRLLQGAEVAYVLELGRRSVFAGDGERGLEFFRRAIELDPGNHTALDWIAKVRVQLADEFLDQAVEHAALSELEEAAASYEEVLRFLPESAGHDERVAALRNQAKVGLQRVLITQNYRDTQSKSYFRDGMRGLREYELAIALGGFVKSTLYDESYQRARERREDVEAMMASERLAKAHGLEAEGHYHAARNEYRMVLLVEEENQAAREGLDRMDVEVRAMLHLAKAEMALLRGDFSAAETSLDAAGKIAVAQADVVSRLRAQLVDARRHRAYDVARGLERDYRYPEAVAAYAALLEEAEFYEDAIARKRTLEGFIVQAAELYAKGIGASTDEEALEYLRQIPVIWPEYLDVAERLAELEERMAERVDADASSDGTADPDGAAQE